MLQQNHQQRQQQQRGRNGLKRRRPPSTTQSQSFPPHNNYPHPAPAPAPKIRGVPASLTPLLVAAIKSSRPPPSSSSSPTAAPPSSSRDVLSHVLSPDVGGDVPTNIGIGNGGAGADAADGPEIESGELSDFISSCAGRHGDEPEVHVACLDFCLDLALDGDAKLRLRRGALAVARSLLHRSRACRERLCGGSGGNAGDGGGDPIRRLVRCLSTLRSGGGDNRARGEESQADGLRRDGLNLLTTLADEFGDLYPKFVVALRYLEEKRGVVNAFSVTANASTSGSRPIRATGHTAAAERERVGGGLTVYALRVARDAALQHGDKEARLVMALVRKVDRYCEALVPRMVDFGVSGGAVVEQEKSTASAKLRAAEDDRVQDVDDGDGNDDDDDVQWEDGDNDVAEGTTSADHEAAVERTLAAMGLLQTGGGHYSVMVDFDGAGARLGGNEADETHASTTVVAVEENGRNFDSDSDSDSDSDRDSDSDSDSHQNRGAGSKDASDEGAEGGDFFFDPVRGGAESTMSPANRDSDEDDERTEIRSQLQKCAQALSSRHLPRLTLWIEALLSADDRPVLRENGEDVVDGDGEEGNVGSGHGNIGLSRRRARGQMARKLMGVRAAASGCVATASKLEFSSTSNSAHTLGSGGEGANVISTKVQHSTCTGGGGGQLRVATAAAASSSPSWPKAIGVTNSGGSVRSRLAANGATRTRQVTRAGGGAIKRTTRLKIKAYST